MSAGEAPSPHDRTIIVIAGTRPEVVKLAPVIRALDERGPLSTRLVFTGQQDRLGNAALLEQGLEPDSRIQFGKRGRSLRSDMRYMAEQIEGELLKWRLDDSPTPWVLVQGDTLSAFAGARAAERCGMPVIHLEAGLRSGDLRQPFPEEIVRRLLAKRSALHLAPNPEAAAVLIAEGIDPHHVHIVGNPALDHLPTPQPGGREVVVTLHRRESFGERLQRIFQCVLRLAVRFEDYRFTVLEHSNPMVASALQELRERGLSNVYLSPPLAREEFLGLISRAGLVMTDSGGVQEEAAALRVPTLVLRDVADRPDGLLSGNTVLAGTDASDIYDRAAAVIEQADERNHGPRDDYRPAGQAAAAAIMQALGRADKYRSVPPSESAKLNLEVDQWLIRQVPVSAEGEVAGALSLDGKVLFYYPEVSGLYLSWLARYACRASGEASLRAARILDGIEQRDTAEPPLTRFGDESNADWRNSAVFLFDLALLARGVADCREAFPDVSTQGAAAVVCRWLAPFFEDDTGLLAPLYRRGEGEIPRRWSTNPGPYQLKALAGLAEFARAFDRPHWQQAALERADELRAAFGPAENPHGELPHPTFYACEGLLALGFREEAAEFALPSLRAISGALLQPESSDHELLRHDVLAQALRLSINMDLEPDLRQRLLLELTRRAAAYGLPGRDPGDKVPVRVWAALFMSEALKLWEGEAPMVGRGHV